MKLKKKSKAFTLTELLVVVVVIGVLSAVVLPKYSKVIETRRTTEAEELMGAIRTEQEKRCALDKEYLMKFDGLKDIVKNPETKNYKLALASTGINATRNDKYSYTLEMPSYADGRICCSGADCEKLNKNYPACDELKSKGDYQDSPASCAGGEEPVTPPTPCNNCGCPEYAAAHVEECNPDKPKTCTDKKPEESQPCNGCGKQTRSVTCNTTTGKRNPVIIVICLPANGRNNLLAAAAVLIATDLQICIVVLSVKYVKVLVFLTAGNYKTPG